MAANNQDFVTYVGDSPAPIFTVVGADGVTPVDISGAAQITWSARRNANDAVVVTKTKSGGGISFVNGGTTGQFQVSILPADLANLSGWYMHYASITDGAGNVTTVEVGRMMVGLTPNWTYDDGTSATEDIYLVRTMIGDTAQSDQQLSDQIILIALKRYSITELAAGECCRYIAARFARQVDVVQGQLKTNYSNRQRAYLRQAITWDQLGYARGGVSAYVGGTSIADKETNVLDNDRVPPNFLIAMHDNLLPESPVGLQADANLGAQQEVGNTTDIV